MPLSRQWRHRFRLLLAAAALMLYSLNATAQCSASAGGVAFGTYQPLSSSAVDSTGNVTVSCLLSLGYTVSLSRGSSSSYSPRTLVNNGYTLDYNLFLNSARSTVWGDGTAGTSSVNGSIGLLLLPNIHTIYGRIPGGQNPAAGGYSDIITVTVTY